MERAVAVIGAGAAGLTAALELAWSGARVTLFEATARAGGALRTEVTGDGARADVGVQLVSSTYDALFGLLERAGAGGVLRRTAGRDALWRRGRAHGITYGSVSSMATSGALPTTLKLKMAAKYLPFLTAQARSLDANDPAATGGTVFDDESIGEWGGRQLGEDFVELLAYPLLAAYYGSEPHETSAGVYHALARVGMDVSVYAAGAGFGAVVDMLLRAFAEAGGQYLPSSPVERLRAGTGGVEVDVGGSTYSFAAAVCAVPARHAAGLVGSVAEPELVQWLARVRSRPTCTLSLRLDAPFPGDWFGLSFPRRERPGDRITAICVQSRKLPGLVPDGDVVVVLPAPSMAPQLLAESDDAIVRTLLPAVEEAVRGASAHVTATHVTRFEDGYTVFGPGHLRSIAKFRDDWLPPWLSLAGDYRVAPTVEGAVRSGARAAARLRAHLSPV